MSKISIIIPIYNVEKYIHKCLTTVVNQTLKDIEIILVNDGTKDNSMEICEEFIKNDSRIKVINKENGGLMSAWIAGVKASTSEYIGFVDSDDWIDENFFECLYENILKYNADIVVGRYQAELPDGKSIPYVIEDGIYQGGNEIKHLLSLYMTSMLYQTPAISICRWDKLYKRDLFLKNFEYFNQKISLGEDVNTNFAIISDCEKVVVLHDAASYHYRLNNLSIANTYKKDQINNIMILNETLYNIAEKKVIDTNIIDIFIGNMIFEEIKKTIMTNMVSKEKKKIILSIMNNNECARKLDSFCSKKSKAHRMYVKMIRLKMYVPCYMIAKMYLK